ncbi:MAG: nucleotide exchange factor GrpE [Suipraeoptans sp.]
MSDENKKDKATEEQPTVTEEQPTVTEEQPTANEEVEDTEQSKSNEDNFKDAVEKAIEENDVMSEEEEKQTKEMAEEIKEESKEKKLFGKKKKDKKDEKIEDLTDKLTRQMAEFDNFRKRTDKEKSRMYEIGVKDVVEKILPVIDNFERGFDGVEGEEKEKPFVQGMDLIYKQLMTMLEDIGVKPIEAVGQPFDPDFHNAVMHVEDENFGENVVAEEFQKGYLYKDTVVRHSMVKVAN